MALAQLGFNGTTMADRAALLSAFTAACCSGATLAWVGLLALGREEALLQVTHLRQCEVQLGLQCSIGLQGLRLQFTHEAVVTNFLLLAPSDCLAV